MSPRAQNMKTGPDALDTAENMSGSAKHENGTRLVFSCTTRNESENEKNMKTGVDALGTAEKESGREKHENMTRCILYRRKRVRARKTGKWESNPSVPPTTNSGVQNMKMGTDALGTAENVFGSAKYEIET
jgi:hypothetical protein